MRISCRILLLSEAEVNYASTVIVNVNVFLSVFSFNLFRTLIRERPFQKSYTTRISCMNMYFLHKRFTLSFFSFNPDPRVRNTFWTITIGGALSVLPIWAIAQIYVQRYLAVKTLRDARRSG